MDKIRYFILKLYYKFLIDFIMFFNIGTIKDLVFLHKRYLYCKYLIKYKNKYDVAYGVIYWYEYNGKKNIFGRLFK